MDHEDKNKKSESSDRKETTPLLKEPSDLYAKKTSKNVKADLVCGEDSAAAEMSRLTTVKGEASSSTTDELEVETEILRRRRETGDELADAVNSYQGMAQMVSPSLGCGLLFGIWICVCHCLSSFMIQCPLLLFLLSLPISVGYMGAKYMTECPMNAKIPHAMMVVGCVGTLALLFRLALLLHTKFSTDERLKKWLKKATNFWELLFLLSFITELGLTRKNSPSRDPLSPNYCNETFHNFFNFMNNVLIALVCVMIFLCCVTGQRCMRRAPPP